MNKLRCKSLSGYAAIILSVVVQIRQGRWKSPRSVAPGADRELRTSFHIPLLITRQYCYTLRSAVVTGVIATKQLKNDSFSLLSAAFYLTHKASDKHLTKRFIYKLAVAWAVSKL